ncbi:protein of unassigned function [Methylobacterium oryzae CBMB20]|jgi:hypothetical protein|uniref:Protein of unassigned function n=1 Tax=Methylobacterium oryzae CBMB20 TaxID=693986 RepID=A0A089Q7A7_9HYPH|nr:protein of unassigned function [Methylobacterium oryzae CBMB20]
MVSGAAPSEGRRHRTRGNRQDIIRAFQPPIRAIGQPIRFGFVFLDVLFEKRLVIFDNIAIYKVSISNLPMFVS